MSLTLDVGCGEKRRGLINVDIRRTKTVDLLADIRHLPFRKHVFSKVYAYNVLEHTDYCKALDELSRVGGDVIIRLDKIYNIWNWLTLEHKYLIHDYHFIPFPIIMDPLRKTFWFLCRNRFFGWLILVKLVPILKTMNFSDVWNYYLLKSEQV